MQVEKDVGVLCMPMEIIHKALFKEGMLNEEREKKEEMEDREGQYC